MHLPAKANSLSLQTFMANKSLSDSDSDSERERAGGKEKGERKRGRVERGGE